DHQVDQVRLLGYLPHIDGLLEQLVGDLDVAVHRADQLLDLAVARLAALPRESTGEYVRSGVLALVHGAREQFADIGVDAEHEWDGVENDPHGVTPFE